MFIQRQKTIIETKNNNVEKSNTPIWIRLKCERKDIDLMVSVSHIGAQDLTADKTSPNPAITKINPLIEDIIKAITWFLVSVDKQDVKARKAPAINQLPIYEIKITLLSGLPR